MSIPTFDALPSASPTARCRSFVLFVRDALNELATGNEYNNMFVANLRDHMRHAWEDAEPQFDALQNAIAQLDADTVTRHGLAGPQLDFKLATVAHWATRFSGGATTDVLRRLLDAINNLLHSLLDATGTGSALSELKDAIRDALDD